MCMKPTIKVEVKVKVKVKVKKVSTPLVYSLPLPDEI
jgi:hypothetical protein